MPLPIIVDLPYPSVASLSLDLRSARIISPAFSGVHSELNAILQYVYHYFNFKSSQEKAVAETLLGIAVAEMEHLQLLGDALLKLGVDPVYTRFPPLKQDFYTARYVSYSKSIEKMLMDDITGELVAISEYEKMISLLDNENVCALISRIILDEQLHVRVLKAKFKELSNKK